MADERNDFEERTRELVGSEDAIEAKLAGVDRTLSEHDRRLAGIENSVGAINFAANPPPPPPTSTSPTSPLPAMAIAATVAFVFWLLLDRGKG